MLETERRAIVVMSDVEKTDCLQVDDAANQLGISKQSLYNYINALGIRRIKFPFDRRAYLTKGDVQRLRQFIEVNRA